MDQQGPSSSNVARITPDLATHRQAPCGEVMTVLGPMAADRLGLTLMHEHIFCDITPLALKAAGGPEAEITLETVWDITYRPGQFLGNHRLNSRQLAVAELTAFKLAGGGAIVDLTTGGIAPDPAGLAAVSAAAEVPVVLGAGFYTDEFVDEDTKAKDTVWLAETIEQHLTEGAWGTDVRCGIIGEVGCSWPLTAFERRSLTAAAMAQQRTGAAITIHPGRHPDAPHEILDVLEAAGADIGRTVIGHLDRTYFDTESIRALARRGCVLEFDFFGIETSNYWMGVANLPTDWMRLRYIRTLIEDGCLGRILLSHDICTRTRCRHLGGHGYGHLVRNVIPLMRDRGFSETEIDTLLRLNPRRLLVKA